MALRHIEPQPTQVLLDEAPCLCTRRVTDHREPGGKIAQRRLRAEFFLWTDQ